MSKNFIMSYSCGKDSTLALYRMIKNGDKPKALLITVDKKVCRSWFHGIPNSLIQDVSDSLDIPVILVETEGGDSYVESFDKALINAKNELEIDSCVFGDIDLEPHREWCTQRCDNAGIEAVFPLWQEEREALVYEFIDCNFKTVIKNVKLSCMGEEFLGEILTKDIVAKIKATGSDPCGENGEYHTFVYDGPLFKNKIKFNTNGVIINGDYGYLDIGEK